MSKIYVIHENSAWVEPLQAAFQELKLPYEEWFLDEGKLDLSVPPPEGVFYNRMTGSFITKHNRAGKGLGVKLFHHFDALQDYVNSAQFEPSVDGITMIQQYIRAPQPYDVNTNTNYNSDAEAVAGLYGMRAIARYLGQELHDLNTRRASVHTSVAIA